MIEIICALCGATLAFTLASTALAKLRSVGRYRSKLFGWAILELLLSTAMALESLLPGPLRVVPGLVVAVFAGFVAYRMHLRMRGRTCSCNGVVARVTIGSIIAMGVFVLIALYYAWLRNQGVDPGYLLFGMCLIVPLCALMMGVARGYLARRAR